MDDKNTTFELIERYLFDELSPDERAAFEARMQEEEAFSKAVESQQLTHKALDVYSQLKTKERVKDIYRQEVQAIKSSRRRVWSLAAAIAVLIIAWGYISATMNYSDEAILASNFEPYPDRITTMAVDMDDQIAAGMKAYNDLNYHKALELLANLPDTIAQIDLINLYRGIAQMKTGDIAAATNTFSQLESAGNNFSEVGRWYLVLIYLKTGDTQKSRSLLERIINEKSFQSEKASQILDAMNHPLRKLPGVR